MRAIHDQALPALLTLLVASACTSLVPERHADGTSGGMESGTARTSTASGPLSAGLVQEPTAPQTPAEAPGDEGWSFQVKPYLFAYGMKGYVSTGRASADVDADFDDLFDALDFGGMLALEASLPGSDWTILSDLMYVQIDGTGLTRGPVGVDVDVEIEQFIGELSAAYEVIDDGRLEVLGGVRYWYMSGKLTANLPGGPQSAEGTEDWFDPIVGLRSRLQLGSDFDLLLRGDMGGFGVGSDFAYNLVAEVGWSLSDTFQLALGYRYLDVDYEDEATYDMTQAGPTIGLAIRF